MATHEEIERKYSANDDVALPSFVGIGRVESRPDAALDAEYFDTGDGALAAQRIAFRRRTGGADEGWHLKFPAGRSRIETQWPLSDGPPAGALDAIRAYVRDRPLEPIARVQTHRKIIHLIGENSAALVEIADDTVSASDVRSGIQRIWREWEVELLDGAPTSDRDRMSLLDAIEERVLAAGATPAVSASKLANALGRTTLADDRPTLSPDRASSASDVLITAIRTLIEELAEIDRRVRSDEPDSVHQFRTRLRRLRSLLASYGELFESDVTEPLRAQLQRLGAVLGEARDAEVMRDRARSLAADHPTVAPEVGEVLAAQWQRSFAAAHGRVVTELSGGEYFRLLDSLDEFVERPALASRGVAPAGRVIPRVLANELKRVLRRAERADAAASEPERILRLHDTRKAAKRLRYAAEAVSGGSAGVFGKRVRHLAASAEAVHDLLGEHRDSVLMQDHLRGASGSDDHAFELGVLHEVERHAAALCLSEYPAALRELRSFR